MCILARLRQTLNTLAAASETTASLDINVNPATLKQHVHYGGASGDTEGRDAELCVVEEGGPRRKARDLEDSFKNK